MIMELYTSNFNVEMTRITEHNPTKKFTYTGSYRAYLCGDNNDAFY